ncbi:MAG: hypothetical protein U0792_05075 [Gemmataceae bacterium]
MPQIVPNRFLVRVAHPCPFVKNMPQDTDKHDNLIDLPESARIENFAALDEQRNFADVRLGWNEFGIGVQVEVKGKQQAAVGDSDKPKHSDGLWLFLDTRDARASHRGSRFCHHFMFLAAGGGADKDEPFVAQAKINAPSKTPPCREPRRCALSWRAYQGRLSTSKRSCQPHLRLDPQEHPRLGVYYVVRDQELGDQFLNVNWEFPFTDDPSLWAVLELVR